MILFRIFRDKLENSHTLDTFYLYHMFWIVDEFTISPLIRNSKKVLAKVRAFLHAEGFPEKKGDRRRKVLYNVDTLRCY